MNELLKRSFNIKIFSLNRIKYEELWEDALSHIRKIYAGNREEYNSSSPFSQLLSVILHLGRMILYYIEDAINGLNIKTAWRPDQIRGLASLTGHDPGRSIASRAAIRMTYNGSDSNYDNQIIYIPDRLKMTNLLNGLPYVVMFGGNSVKMTLKPGNYIDANIVQGKVTIQQATSNGTEMQSFNFAERNYASIDQYYIFIYVNGEPWKIVNNFNDMVYQEHACVVKTGQTGGIDVFFGNGTFGMIPPEGALIRCEYLVNNGEFGNFPKDVLNSANYWKIDDNAYLVDGSEIDLTTLMNINCKTDSIMGAFAEDITLTQRIAPHSSRSMVLANATNYKYFLEKMKMFSVIDVLQGYNTIDDKNAELEYRKAQYNYTNTKKQYETALNLYGRESDLAAQLSAQLNTASKKMSLALDTLEHVRMDDNTVYLFLIPKISQRIQSSENYFTCDEERAFKLTEDEKYNILNLIDMSGQSIISVENKIMQVLYPKFAINIIVRIWEGYEYENIYTSVIDAISKYLINSIRRDRIPVSDIISICENINGIDSVTVYFDADPENKLLYGNDFDGIDEFGDIVLERNIINRLGETVIVRDLYPIFRGGFTNKDGVEYSNIQQKDVISAVNVSVNGYSSRNLQTNIENKLIGS